jgi:hypothetical protein
VRTLRKDAKPCVDIASSVAVFYHRLSYYFTVLSWERLHFMGSENAIFFVFRRVFYPLREAPFKTRVSLLKHTAGRTLMPWNL